MRLEVIPKSNVLIGADVLGKESIPVSVLVHRQASKEALDCVVHNDEYRRTTWIHTERCERIQEIDGFAIAGHPEE